MGMFDYIKVTNLPKGTPSLDWQTKDTPAQFCDRYEVRDDGSLWHRNYDVEDRSDPNAEGLERMIGCMTSVNHRWEPCEMTGEVRFYGMDPDKTWWEFSAYFVSGKLSQMHQLEPKP